MLDLVFGRLRFVKQECGADIQQFCGDVELGEGRIFSCLSSKEAEISESCSTAIGDVELPES